MVPEQVKQWDPKLDVQVFQDYRETQNTFSFGKSTKNENEAKTWSTLVRTPLTVVLAVSGGVEPPLTGVRWRLRPRDRNSDYARVSQLRWRLDQSERDTWHWRVSVRGVRVSVRGQAIMGSVQSMVMDKHEAVVERQKDYMPPELAI
ncbi:hypothetical protein Tco_0536930 [Tanacetum coccineum]